MKTENHKAHRKLTLIEYIPMKIFPVIFCITTSSAIAHDVTVNISGMIQGNTCTVTADSTHKQVSLGNIATKSFSQAGDSTSPVRFTLDLEQCGETASSVQVTLNGIADSNNEQLLALDNNTNSATGIGIAILDETKTIIPINSTSKNYPLKAGASQVSLVFYAQYLSNGATIHAGNANASTTFTLTYP